MKNKHKLLYSLCLIIFVVTTACNKTVNILQLPPATHTGANMLACKVNGQVVISTGAGGKLNQYSDGVVYEAYRDSNTIIGATSYNSFSLDMGSNFNFVLGTYKIVQTPYCLGAVFDTFQTDNNNGGYITYTYYDGNVLAGTFAFDAISAHGVIIHITEGRFDIQNH